MWRLLGVALNTSVVAWRSGSSKCNWWWHLLLRWSSVRGYGLRRELGVGCNPVLSLSCCVSFDSFFCISLLSEEDLLLCGASCRGPENNWHVTFIAWSANPIDTTRSSRCPPEMLTQHAHCTNEQTDLRGLNFQEAAIFCLLCDAIQTLPCSKRQR